MEAHERVRGALARLREQGPLAELLRRAPRELCDAARLDRVMLTRLSEATLVPVEAHFRGDEKGAANALAVLSEHPLPLVYPLPETEMVRMRSATIVRDPASHPRVHAPLLAAMDGPAYVAAPVVLEGRAIGFFHAARAGEGLDEHDRESVWEFAEGFANVVERAVLRRRVREQRRRLRQLMAFTDALSGELSDRPIDLEADREAPGGEPLSAQPAGPGPDGDARLDRVLTRRELDVLRLMARGASNRAIATELVVSEGTIKFHVKNILRKLGAANRVEAACRHGVCGVYGQHWGGPEGDLFGRAARRFEEMGVGALLINCIPPDHVPGMVSYVRDFTDMPLGVYPNLGYYTSAGWTSDRLVSGEEYAAMALEWREEGAQIVGGCCGVGPELIASARDRLEGVPRGQLRPDDARAGANGAALEGRRAPEEAVAWPDAHGRDLFPLPLPEIACDAGVFVPTQGSFLIWRHLFREGLGNRQRCLDVGCGTGILAVQLALNGADHVHAIDIDPEAVDNALANAFRNGVADRVSAAAVDLWPWVPDERYELIVASLYEMPGLVPLRILRPVRRPQAAHRASRGAVGRLPPAVRRQGRDGRLPARGHVRPHAVDGDLARHSLEAAVAGERPQVVPARGLTDLAGRDDAATAREAGQPAGEVDGAAVPVARALEALARRDAAAQQQPVRIVAGAVDESEHCVEQRVRLGRDEHRRVADRLDEPHRRPYGRLDAPLEVAHHGAQLVRGDMLAELGEPDDVHERHHDALGAGQAPALELGAADHGLADLLAQAPVEDQLEGGAREWREHAQRLRVAQAEIALGVAGLQQRLAERRHERGGDRVERVAHHADQLEEALLVEAGVEQRLGVARQLELLVGEHARVGVDRGVAERPPGRLEEAELEPRPGGDLAQRVAGALRLEHPLDRQQREPVLAGRATQVVEREALALERAQQLEACVAGGAVVEPVEEPLRLEVDRHADIVAVSRRGCAVRPGP